MNYYLFLLLSFLMMEQSCEPQMASRPANSINQPKREFRAFWIVTLDNKDFPSRPGMQVAEMKAELREMLNYHQRQGMNAAIFQVRPCADAFYYSEIEPWSEWLSGRQGIAIRPFFDPLAFIVEECHQRNMEIHAWFNPYRAVFSVDKSDVHARHIVNRQPSWFIQYGNRKQFNPGIPAVRHYITSVVMDVVKRYDIDGVQFDDYFYPYKIYGKEFPDDQTFNYYGRSRFRNKSDWRRDNVDQLIKMVHDSIQRAKPYVKFGISPMGVWRNRSEDPRGSATSVGQSSYDYLGADVRKWLEQGWIDYVAPQLYWSVGHPRADYRALIDWWSANDFGRHIYIGQAFYKINNDADTRWRNPRELPKQLAINRKSPSIEGSIFFRARSLMDNTLAVTDTIKERFYPYPALIPPMPWKDATPPGKPQKLRIIRTKKRAVLKWEAPQTLSEQDRAAYYVIYRFKGNERIDLSQVENIISIQQENMYYESIETNNKLLHTYAVAAVDRLHNESEAVMVSSF